MSTFRPVLRALVTSSFLAAMPLCAAHAADPNDVADHLKATFSKQGVELAWTGVSGDDSAMTLSGVTVGTAGNDKRVAIGDVTLKDVTEKNGGYVVGTADLPAYSVKEAGSSFDMNGVEISGLRLPSEDGVDPLDSVMMYDKAKIDSLSVKRGGTEVFSLAGFHVDVTPPSGDDPLKFDGAADHFTADLSKVEDPKSKAAIKALGYENIQGSMAMAGSWSPKTGDASLDRYDLTVKNAGTFSIRLKMGGYTPEFIRSLHAIQKKIAEAPQDKKGSQSMAMLGLMQQLSFGGATVSFADDSLTGKIMDYVAAQEGMKRSDIANQAKAVLPFVLAKLNNPELSSEVTAAVSTFLDNPKNLSIVAAPPNPVPFALIMAGAMTAPQQLPQTLGVKIQANQ